MTQRILVMAVAAVLFLGASSFGQDEKKSVASPSDVPVDQIKKAVAKKTQDDAGTSDAKPADAKATDAKAADAKKTDKKATPAPVAEGTAVAQPGCKTEECSSCNRCRRGRLMGRVRSMLGRRCCR